MKKTQLVELLSIIKRTIVTFISIALFVGAGVAAYLGLTWSSVSLKDTIDNFYKDGEIYDYSFSYVYGFGEDVINELKSLEDVKEAEGIYSAYSTLKMGEYRYNLKIDSLNEKINVPMQVEGNLPQKENEIAITKSWAKAKGINIGDDIKIDNKKSSTVVLNILNNDKDAISENEESASIKEGNYKVTAFVETAKHLSNAAYSYGINDDKLPIDVICYVAKDSFIQDKIVGYNTIYVQSKNLENLNVYSNEYELVSENEKDKIEDVILAYCDRRYATLKNNADEIDKQFNLDIDDADADILSAHKDIEKAQKDIEKGNKDLIDGRKELLDGENKLKDALIDIDEAEDELSKGWEEYNNGVLKFNELKTQVNSLNDISLLFEGHLTEYNTLKNSIGAIPHYQINMSYLENFKAFLNSEQNLEIKNAHTLTATKVNDLYTYLTSQEYINLSEGYKASNLYSKLKTIKEDLSRQTEQIYASDALKFSSLMINLIPDDSNSSAYSFDNVSKTLFMQKTSDSISFGTLGLGLGAIDNLTTSGNYLELSATYNNFLTMLNALAPYQFDASGFDSYGSKLSDLVIEYKKVVTSLNTELSNLESELNNAHYKLLSGDDELDEAYSDVEKAKKDIADGWDEYYTNLKKLEDGKKDLAQGEVDLIDGENKLSEAKDNLLDFEDGLKDLKDYDYTSSPLKDNSAYAFSKSTCEIFEKLRTSMAGLFVLVGALVCYSAVSRLIFEHSKLIGTKKALGFSVFSISKLYLTYTVLAGIFGLLFGICFARFIIEPMLLSTLGETMCYEKILYSVSLKDIALFGGINILFIVIVTYVACHAVLKKQTIDLLNNNNVSDKKANLLERTKFFKKLPLLVQTIISNFFTDKRRVFATVVGIAGCTALIVSALSLKNFVSDSFTRHYEKVYNFDTVIYIDSDSDSVQRKLDELNIEYAEIMTDSVIIEGPDGKNIYADLFVVEDNKVNNYISLYEDGIKQEINGLWSSYSFKDHYKVDDNYLMNIKDLKGNKTSLQTRGFFEYYILNNQLVVDKKTYEEYFNENYKNNSLIVKLDNVDKSELLKELNNTDGYLNIVEYYDLSEQIFLATENVLTIVVALYILLAVMMALLVLLNLFVMFIEEKKYEVIVLMINGYSSKDGKRYIYSDTILLTVVSIIIGIGVGVYIGNISLAAYKSETVYFMSGANKAAILFGIIFTIVLVALMSYISLRKIDKFKLSDISS